MRLRSVERQAGHIIPTFDLLQVAYASSRARLSVNEVWRPPWGVPSRDEVEVGRTLLVGRRSRQPGNIIPTFDLFKVARCERFAQTVRQLLCDLGLWIFVQLSLKEIVMQQLSTR